jgi:hypothetical protein
MKVDIQISHAELKLAVAAWLISKGISMPPGALMVIDAFGNVTVDLDTAVEVPPVQPVVPQVTIGPGLDHKTTPTPLPEPPFAIEQPVVAPIIKDPGPKFSLKCVATCFGYNDPGDPTGTGAWGANNNSQDAVGVSVPIPILEATLGGSTLTHVAGVTASVNCLDSGKSFAYADIRDKGPGDSVNGQHALLVGKDGVLHALDLTAGMCKELGVKYDPVSASYTVIWWLNDPNGVPLEMKGLDAPKKVI